MTKKPPTTVPSLAEGQVWAVKVAALGYCPAVLSRIPTSQSETDFAFVYVKPTLSDSLPDAKTIGPPASWGTAWISLLPTISLRKGRWAYCGEVSAFHRDDWPVPPVRASNVDETAPVGEWASTSGDEMWSIEVSEDEPTRTIIANEPATRTEALRFPSAANLPVPAYMIEKLLKEGFKRGFKVNGPEPTSGSGVLLEPVSESRLDDWRVYGNRRRAAHVPMPEWWPAGRGTRRRIKPGTWIAMPLLGGGFGAAMYCDIPAPQFRLFSDSVLMSMRRVWDKWPTINDVQDLGPSDGAIIGQTDLSFVIDGRWRVLGRSPDFDPQDWPWPLPWFQMLHQKERGEISIAAADGSPSVITPRPEIMALDPLAGQRCSGSITPDGFEFYTGQLARGLFDDVSDTSAIVTPERLDSWRRINAAILETLQS